jgi:hypothetical protein
VPSQQFTAVFGRVTQYSVGQSNARVELHAQSHSDSLETFSDANGYYGFLNVPQDVLTLTASNQISSARLELTVTQIGVVTVAPDLEFP